MFNSTQTMHLQPSQTTLKAYTLLIACLSILAGTPAFAQGNDFDSDGVPDQLDNCIDLANADQTDIDGDGIGNRCDPDLNNDCNVNFIDYSVLANEFLSVSSPLQDLNSDGVVNFLDISIFVEFFLSSPGPSGVPNDCAAQTPAVFSDLEAVMPSDQVTPLTGSVTVTDINPGEALLVTQTNAQTTYGTFSIDGSGAWSYSLNTTDPAVAALGSGDTLMDTIQISSVDGTLAQVVITINGVDVPSDNNVAIIIDTDPTDTGELRYALGGDGPLAQGRVSVQIKRLDDDLGNGDAFITLYNENTNNDGAILDFRIRDDNFAVRNPSSIDTSALPHSLDEFMDVVITWEYPGGSTTVLPQVTISVDGVSLAPYTPDNNAFGGVTHVAIRFGDNAGVRPSTGRVTVDNLAIYSDAAGMTAVFTDDFESYANGDSLDTDNPASPYNASTSEATVETVSEGVGPGTPGNQLAEIIDTDPTDTGELRYELGGDGPLAAGRLEVAVKRLDDSLGNGDAFIALYNANTNVDGAILDFRIRDNSFAVRSPSSIDTSALPHTLDSFMNVVVTWEYPSGDTTLLPTVTISVDGVSLAPFTPDNNSFGGVTHVSFRFGDNSGVREDTGIYSVDEVAIYSDTTGMNEVFSDNFESYTPGDSLDTDNPDSPYNASTSEATVGIDIDPNAGQCSGNHLINIIAASDNGQSTANNGPEKAIDDLLDPASRWESNGVGATLTVDLGVQYLVREVGIAWFEGDQRIASFSVSASIDGLNFESILSNQQSSGTTQSFERYDTPDTPARYLRIENFGNSQNSSNAIIESTAFGCTLDTPTAVFENGNVVASDFALDPLQPPGSNFELISWALDTPADLDGNGFADRTSEQNLDAGFTDEYFFTGSDGGMVFRSTIDGARTSENTNYTRSELREMLRRGDTSISTRGVNENNWVLGYQPDPGLPVGGRNGVLRGTLAVNHVTETGDGSQVGRMIIGQIHAENDEPLRLYYRKYPENERGFIYLAHEIRNSDDIFFPVVGPANINLDDAPTDNTNPANGIALNEIFSYEITQQGARIDVIVRRGDSTGPIIGHNFVDMEQRNSGYDVVDEWMYFKAGAYMQNNTGNGTDYDQVTFYALENTHD